MGVPALQHERVAARSRSSLALVPSDPRPARPSTSRRSSSRARGAARHREAFTVFLVVAITLAVLGVTRVALCARAAAVSIESGRLREQIKDERFKGDMLEIQQSALATPSRIQAIAAATMRMKQAGAACYITIGGATVCTTDESEPTSGTGAISASTPDSSRRGVADGLLASIMNTAAGEAQALLLGDVGLASSR